MWPASDVADYESWPNRKLYPIIRRALHTVDLSKTMRHTLALLAFIIGSTTLGAIEPGGGERIASVRGVRASANLYSLIETAKAKGLEPYAYLRHLFMELPKANTVEAIEALLPGNLAKDQIRTG